MNDNALLDMARPVLYVALGVFGFVLALFFDHPRIERVRWAKLTIGVVAFTTLGYAVVVVSLHPSRFIFPSTVSAIGWVLAGIFLILFAYSVFIELPFRQAYLGTHDRTRVVNTGTYAMSRHPGVLWAALALFFLVLATGSKVLLVATPVWIFMDVTWAYIEDRFYFPITLAGYRDYRKQVPMFVPTASSLRRAAKTILRPRNESNAEGVNGRDA